MKRIFEEKFFYKTTTVFTHLTLIVLILSSFYFCYITKLNTKGEIGEAATILGHFIGDLLRGKEVFFFSKVVFFSSSILWILGILIPFSSWISALSYLLFSSMVFENSLGAEKHSVHIMPNLLIIYAFFYQIYGKKFNSLKKKRLEWIPAWAIELSIFTIGVSHTWAGLSKLRESGLDWANGDSLKIWVYLWGNKNFLNDLVLTSPWFASFSQWSVLIIETFAVVIFFSSRRWRLIFGILLTLFHFVNEWMWGWMFLYWCPLILVLHSEYLTSDFFKKHKSFV